MNEETPVSNRTHTTNTYTYSFIKSTAKDYDLEIHQVQSIAQNANNYEDFYSKLEQLKFAF